MVDIGMNVENIVAWELGTIGMNPMIMTFRLELGNVKKLERYILGLSFELLNVIYEDYCMEIVIINLKWNPENRNDMIMEEWQEMSILDIIYLTWVRMDFPKVWELEMYKEIHGKTLGNKWVFEKEKD